MDEETRFDGPDPKSGIGKSGLRAAFVALTCLVLIVTLSVAMAFNKDVEPSLGNGPGTEDVGDLNPGGTTETPGETTQNPGETTQNPEQDVVRELTEDEKRDVIFEEMFGEGIVAFEDEMLLIDNNATMEIDGQEVDAVKLILEGFVMLEDGTEDFRIVSASVQKTAENENMTAKELALYIYNQSKSTLEMKNDDIVGSFELGDNVLTNKIAGTRVLLDAVRGEDGQISEEEHARYDSYRDNLCEATGFDSAKHNVHISSFNIDVVDNRGNVEFVTLYSIHDLDGKLLGYYESNMPVEGRFLEESLQNEVLSGTAFDLKPFMTIKAVDSKGVALDQNATIETSAEVSR